MQRHRSGTVEADVRPAEVAVGVEALGDVLRSALTPVPARHARLSDAFGATLAEQLAAANAFPAANTAAMDGFAVSGPGPRWVLRRGVCAAGRSGGFVLAAGEAIRIATGAPTPPGTTAVIRHEHTLTAPEGGPLSVTVAPHVSYRDDTRTRGEYWSAGNNLATAGARVDPALVSVALTADIPFASVRGPLRAEVLLTGDEIRGAGPLAAGQIRDALGPVLPRYLRGCDIECENVWRLPDDRAQLRSWFERDTDADLVVSVGATGHGAADHLRGVLDEIGAHILVDGVRMRPGGSQIVARLADGRTLLALPGNPLAAVSALLVTGPALVAARTDRRPPPPTRGRIINPPQPHPDLTRVLPARQVGPGRWAAAGTTHTPHLADLLDSPALALLPPRTDPTALVEILPIPH